METKAIVSIIGIAGITAIECVALAKGMDGTFLSLAIGGIGAIVGGLIGFKFSLSKQE